ncbi:MAG: type II toxin-antitoxin system VapC family toxin [Rhodoferax sp.]|nr:type II toxin-antitoxin system VapC family toxin [Rhodoferax sp.]
MRYLLDTNIVSYYLRRVSPGLEAKVNDALKHHIAAISVITRAELRFGEAGMAAEDRRRGFIDRFLLLLPSLYWSVRAADQYGDIKNSLKTLGTPIGEMDTQIAAHALAENLVLVTHNTRHFERVPGLQIEDWLA